MCRPRRTHRVGGAVRTGFGPIEASIAASSQVLQSRIHDVALQDLTPGFAAGNPNAGDDCTTVPDEIAWQLQIARITVVDFSPSCKTHDRCYGRWGTSRKNCDDTFLRESKAQCRKEYPHPNGIFPLYWVRDKPGRVICDKVADIYHYGVWQLGGESWPDIALRYDRRARIGCPLIGAGGQKPDVTACFYDQQGRSYPPKVADRVATMRDIAGRIRALLPFG